MTSQTEAALLAEVYAAPKPGLVDRLSCGSHHDMSYETFTRSIRAIGPYFKDFMEKSAAHPDDLVLPALRAAGQQAEAAMLRATGGINTHKGLIFSLGLITACLVRLYKRLGRPPLETDLPDLIGLIRYNSVDLTKELCAEKDLSHGIRVYRSYGVGGIRQEASDGFPAVFSTGLPSLRQYRTAFEDPDLPLLMTLLRLILVTSDTNLLARGGPEGLAFMRTEAHRILSRADHLTEHELLQKFQSFDEAAVKKHLSPGGAADHLALCLFLDRALDEKLIR